MGGGGQIGGGLADSTVSGRQDLTYHTFEELVPDNVESPRPSVDFIDRITEGTPPRVGRFD